MNRATTGVLVGVVGAAVIAALFVFISSSAGNLSPSIAITAPTAPKFYQGPNPASVGHAASTSSTAPTRFNSMASNTNMQRTKTLALGESTTIQGLTAMPTQVIEDSRCPKGAQCIQAGTVKVNVRLSYLGFGVNQVFTLDVPVTARGVTGELTAVTPEKVTGQNIDPSNYRFTFLISK